MADGRGRLAWDTTLALMTYVGSMFEERPPQPVDLIPARYRPKPIPEPVRSEAVLEVESRAAWQVMHQFFRGKSNGR